MPIITTKDGTEIFYKDWGKGQPLFFHHGWPLSADDWDSQMMFFLAQGYRVIAHDRRGHGRSAQTANGHDMDTYAADVATVTTALDLKDAIHIGHSTGGGEVARYVAKYGKGRVAKAVLISAIPPTFMQSAKNPDGVPKEVVDGIRDGTANHRAQFYKDITIPFYGFNRPGAAVSEGIQLNWWRQGMMGAPSLITNALKFSPRPSSTTISLRSISRFWCCMARTTRFVHFRQPAPAPSSC